MFKRLTILFFLISLGLFFLLSGILGPSGYLVNRNIEQQINELEYELLRLDSEIENLKTKKEELSTVDGIREAALKLGYNVRGDEVFHFENSALQESNISSDDIFKSKKEFVPFNKSFILAVSCGISLLFCLILFIIFSKKDVIDDFEQEQSGDNSNYLKLN